MEADNKKIDKEAKEETSELEPESFPFKNIFNGMDFYLLLDIRHPIN